MRFIVFSLLFFIAILNVHGIVIKKDTVCYANRNGIHLNLEIMTPSKIESKVPVIVFFFGGGWIKGGRGQFQHQAEYFAQKGLVTVLADYRTKQLCGATPFDCVKDAKSVIRFIKERAETLKVDTTKIVASGGSAGGHLAAACAYISSYNEPDDNLAISSRPSALVLFNPVIDNSEKGYGSKTVKKEYKYFSPLHNIKGNNALPTLFMIGSKDKLIPLITAENYKRITEENGAVCDLKVYEGQEHGFFNYKPNNIYYDMTLQEMEKFLKILGYL